MVVIQTNISYEIPDDGTVAQHGQLIPGNIPIIAVPLCQDFMNIQNQSAMQIDHMGFLRCYHVDFEKGYILYAPWEETLSEWLLGRKVYVPYRPRGFPNDAYRVSTALKEFIRVMLFAMVHLHHRNHCFDRDFGVDDVVVSEGLPKFKGVGIRKKASELDRTRDFGNFRELVKHQVLGGGVAAHCPRDMIHFLGLLRHPRRYWHLILNHCALWKNKEKINFFQYFIDDAKYLGHNRFYAMIRKINGLKELRNWKDDIDRYGRSPMVKVYNKGESLASNVSEHYKFLRHFRVHAGEHSHRGRKYDLDMVEGVISASFPSSLHLLQDILHEENLLARFLPREIGFPLV